MPRGKGKRARRIPKGQKLESPLPLRLTSDCKSELQAYCDGVGLHMAEYIEKCIWYRLAIDQKGRKLQPVEISAIDAEIASKDKAVAEGDEAKE